MINAKDEIRNDKLTNIQKVIDAAQSAVTLHETASTTETTRKLISGAFLGLIFELDKLVKELETRS